MKHSLICAALVALMLSACGKKEEAPKVAASPPPAPATATPPPAATPPATGAPATATPPPAATPSATAAKAPAGDEAVVTSGRKLFNTNCGHCHGPDAASPDPKIDLRKLRKRHAEKMDEVFSTAVLNGRPDKGMPAWKGVIPEGDIASIKAFVDSVQPPS